jgi:alanine racemase
MWFIQTKHRYKTLNRVELVREAILHNVQVLRRLHPDFQIIPVLKSNAYGHGIREMAQVLNDTDCNLLAVDGYFEAGHIRRITKHRILVLGYIAPANAALLDTKRCSFVVQDTAMLAALGSLRVPVSIHLELNTGMNRLGLTARELPTYLRILKRHPKLILEGVMSHLADADNPKDSRLTDRQVVMFDRSVDYIRQQGFNPQYVHIAQTAGSTKAQSMSANALRLGIGLYGINPLQPHDKRQQLLSELQPVLSLKSTIIKVIDVVPGDIVGYNATFQAMNPTRVGVLPIGYYEGVPREVSNHGVVTTHGVTLPVIGRVSMNHTMIDLGTSALGVGDEVTVFSADPLAPNSIARISAERKLFAYSLLTGISSSVRRCVV